MEIPVLQKQKKSLSEKGGQKRKATNDGQLSNGNGTKNKISKQAPKTEKKYRTTSKIIQIY